MCWSHLGGPFRICALELAPGASIWRSEPSTGKILGAENGRTIGCLGTIQRRTVCPGEAVISRVLQML